MEVKVPDRVIEKTTYHASHPKSVLLDVFPQDHPCESHPRPRENDACAPQNDLSLYAGQGGTGILFYVSQLRGLLLCCISIDNLPQVLSLEGN